MKYRLSLCSAVCALLLFVAPLYCHGENPKQWWHSFDDSRLDTLIAIGMANNYDVSMAHAPYRYRQSDSPPGRKCMVSTTWAGGRLE